MSQSYWGNISAATTSGTQLATLMNDTGDALISSHKGGTRPSYAVAGIIWVDDTNTTWDIKIYDGGADIVIGQVNTTTNEFVFAVAAEDVSFDNAITALSATDVQEAIEQLDARVTALETP